MPQSRIFDRILLKALHLPLKGLYGLALVIAAVVATAAFRAAFVTDLLPYLFFMPVILIGTFLVGPAAGVTAILLSALLAGQSLSATNDPFSLTGKQWAAQTLFSLVNLGIVFLAVQLRRTMLVLERVAEERRCALENLGRQTGERSRLATIVEQSREFIGYADLGGRVQFVNEAGRQLVGRANADGQAEIADYFKEPDRSRFRSEILPEVARSGLWSGEVTLRHFGTGEALPVRFTIFPLVDDADARIGYGTIITDLRAQKAADAQREMLTRELAHRMKNTLAMVQAISAQTLRSARTMEEGRDAIASRLTALARAQDILTHTSWEKADIVEVVNAAIEPHRGDAGHVTISGPHLDLQTQRALGLSLAIHELATNAAKYGALSVEGGRVDMCWSADGNFFRFEWIETGGPTVEMPSARGFGSKLIERIVAAYFDGTGRLEFDPSGVRFILEGALGPGSEQKA
ncbi:sensor histidine kinase [Mangrovicella endophytica]|uniref:sensor histidine kinase n=1 Tax=Mangrovicella endophytica TaxID=2066697 RepID=UPI000C9E6F77|nr:HWE histidine kinase domain-containing protein [Mangrovicella endophytica]